MTAGPAPAAASLADLDETVHAALAAYWDLADSRGRWMRPPVAKAFYATQALLSDYDDTRARDHLAGSVSRSTRAAADDLIAAANTLTRTVRAARTVRKGHSNG